VARSSEISRRWSRACATPGRGLGAHALKSGASSDGYRHFCPNASFFERRRA
jgi:hypothetical protein